MRLISITPARNEGWVIGFGLRSLMRWVDHAIVLVHASTDDTLEQARAVAADNPGRVTVLVENDPVWREMQHRQMLLEKARELGATHMATVDADEFLTGNLLPIIREQIACLPPGSFLQVPMPQLWGSLDKYALRAPSMHGRMVADWGQTRTTVAFCDHRALRWKTGAAGYDHHHREPYCSRLGLELHCSGGLAHLQFAHTRRLVAKHAAYKITERLRWPDKSVHEIDCLYNLAIKTMPVTTAEAPADWWEPYAGIRGLIDLESEPWQEQWCREQVDEYGPLAFAGLDLFGVVCQEPEPVTR